jgi:predicted nuclease of predicted toxin-antitoxin system
MALPKKKETELPLLREIEAVGGEAKPQTIYSKVTSHFPQITKEDLEETITGGINKWTNRIQWARQSLVLKGELERYPRGIWRITAKGRQRLRAEVPPLKEAPRVIKEQATKLQQPKRHEELKQKMVEIGKKLGYYVSAEEGPEYRHDVLWKITQYKTPSHVIEVCEGGVLAKDFDSLNWARENWDARGILIVTDDKDFIKASRRLAGQPRIIAVKAETIDLLYELINADLELLKSIFGEHSKW